MALLSEVGLSEGVAGFFSARKVLSRCSNTFLLVVFALAEGLEDCLTLSAAPLMSSLRSVLTSFAGAGASAAVSAGRFLDFRNS